MKEGKIDMYQASLHLTGMKESVQYETVVPFLSCFLASCACASNYLDLLTSTRERLISCYI